MYAASFKYGHDFNLAHVKGWSGIPFSFTSDSNFGVMICDANNMKLNPLLSTVDRAIMTQSFLSTSTWL